MTTILEFMNEMETWHSFSNEEVDCAEISDINNHNNTTFQLLLSGWIAGDYDEDPELVCQELIGLLNI